MMQVEIITIGDEILIGQTIDTNSAWLGEQLNARGMDVAQVRSIRDTPEAIVNALDALMPDTQLVLMTGGLGPTKDDLTKHTLNSYFGGTLKFHPDIYAHIEDLFSKFNRTPNALNRGQAEVPDVCTPLANPVGTAPGMRFERDGIHYISMPGVPYEMKSIMEQHVLPWVEETWGLEPIVHRTLLTQGVPESELASTLADWEDALPEPLKLAYLPSPGMVKLRLTARSGAEEENRKKIDVAFEEARKLLGDCVFGEGAQTMEEVLGHLLAEHGLTVSTAESCTGGNIAARLTAIPGSSRYYVGSVVAYANDIKQSVLGVNEADLLVHGAVSEPVVKQMARGVAKRTNSTFAVSTSGIAGPDGGTADKPVGTVWIGIHGPTGTTAKRYHFGADRGRNIKRATNMAMDALRVEVLRYVAQLNGELKEI